MIAIIPARGGSKGLPGKNIKCLNGVPLIAYTVHAAKKAECIDRVVVTTDDKNIASVAMANGAEIPFIRPAELASDQTSAIDVYLHAIDYLVKHDKGSIEKFMVLLPTVPFRTEKHIDEAYSLFVRKKAETLISVVEAEIPPSWYLYCDGDGKLHNCGYGLDKGVISNRQLDQAYLIPNGAIYILDYRLLKEKRTYYCNNTVPYIMGRMESVDIDTIDDFNYASFLISDNSEISH